MKIRRGAWQRFSSRLHLAGVAPRFLSLATAVSLREPRIALKQFQPTGARTNGKSTTCQCRRRHPSVRLLHFPSSVRLSECPHLFQRGPPAFLPSKPWAPFSPFVSAAPRIKHPGISALVAFPHHARSQLALVVDFHLLIDASPSLRQSAARPSSSSPTTSGF